MKYAKCRDCGCEIVFARDPQGNNLPFSRVRPLFTIEWGVVNWDARPMRTELYEVHFNKCKSARACAEPEGLPS